MATFSTPLYSEDYDVNQPVFKVTCASASYDFSVKKAEGKSPANSAVEGEKLRLCISQSLEKVKETPPCNELRQLYMQCLQRHSRLKSPCSHLYAELEECAAKHIGRLD